MFDSEIPIFVHVSRLNRVFIAAHSSNHHPQNWHLYIDKIDLFFFQISIYLSIYIYIVLNHPSPGQEQKRFYSRVLQGHLALATAVFPEGTCGLRLGKPWVKPRTNAEKKHGEKVTNMVKSGRLFIVILDGISLSYLFVHYFCWKPWVMKKWSRQTVDKRIIKIIKEKGFRTISVIFGSETSFPKAPGCLCAKTFMAGRHGVWTRDWPWHWSLSECTRGSCTEPRC